MTTEQKLRLFGDQIRLARCKRRISQEELGKQLGVSGAAVCKWESGEQPPTFINFLELQRILGLQNLSLEEGKNV